MYTTLPNDAGCSHDASIKTMKKLYIVGVNYFDFKLLDAINAKEPAWNLVGFLDQTPVGEKKKHWTYNPNVRATAVY